MNTQEIEDLSRDLLGRIWRTRRNLTGQANPNPIDLLKPEYAAQVLGIEYLEFDTLPNFMGGGFEAAGVIDRGDKRIAVATKFGYEVARFTGSHEIGHWLLHPDAVMLRERPIKGLAPNNYRRSQTECQADIFAAYFLMPRKLVEQEFIARFGEDWPFYFDENVAFWLGAGEAPALLRPRPSEKARALALATARRYQGRHFNSLAETFGVSALSMAIQLEEFGFVNDDC